MAKTTGQFAAWRKAMAWSRKNPGSRIVEKAGHVAVYRKGENQFARVFRVKTYSRGKK